MGMLLHRTLMELAAEEKPSVQTEPVKAEEPSPAEPEKKPAEKAVERKPARKPVRKPVRRGK